jgi:hypothetical protein
MNKREGIVMANGMVLKDGAERFKADKSLVSETLQYVAKISKGLHSGVLNDDPDFAKFQQEAMSGLVKKETDKLCDHVVLGAEDRLRRMSTSMAAQPEVTSRYIYGRRTSKEVEPIILGADDKPKKLKDVSSGGTIKSLIEKRGDELASLNPDEVSYIKEINKESEKIREVREQVMEKILSKKVAKKKVAKKKAKKKVAKKKKTRNISIQ